MLDYPDSHIADILKRTHTIAVVGLSAKSDRASHQVAQYLSDRGYRVIGVNPGLAGQEMFGETVVADLASLPDGVDMIDIFRRPEAVEPVVDAALAHVAGLRTIWMQLGVTNAAAQSKAEAAGLDVIQNRCPKIEYPRLFGGAALTELV
ncbi:CoA-binding protein [Aliiroseovarius subalbicans]|uniref:CoA-binding protein n=1 Tax=Aliiroseovarius subalbicans TaxID=2925840 RepID=UPI001F57C7EF|nr:CoA-binding protein [Aliiroseovarius subalbicans]MCI2398932.1 CoA-binding protein [Aliiroseovarius subalbicans]